MKQFDTLPLPDTLIRHLAKLGYSEMTPVQQEAIPPALEGKDLIALAQTGSGKTLAFGIPVLAKIDSTRRMPQALIVTPTRELADQIADVLRTVARFRGNLRIMTLCGGMPMRREMESLQKGAHLIVGTPGRILDHLGKKSLTLSEVQCAVLDEADRMLDMGFFDDVQKILSHTPKGRQTLLFSATMHPKIEGVAATLMRTPQKIEVRSTQEKPDIREHFYTAEDKERALLRLLRHFKPNSAIVFATTKVTVQELTHFLQHAGFDAVDLQGDLDQRERKERLIQFSGGSARILVATDLAARGLDIEDVDLVVNYEMPQIDEHYTHRIGRTGRAGKSGLAVSLVTRRAKCESIDTLTEDETYTMHAPMRTLGISGGKRHKLRAGDIAGALHKEVGLPSDAIGKIVVLERESYVSVTKAFFQKALEGVGRGKIKGKRFKAWPL